MKASPLIAAALLLAPVLANAAPTASKETLMRGQYLITIGGCNDCHTDGYAQSGGQLPTRDWLTGSVVGFNGPWGTTYPGNLRLAAQRMDENEWVKYIRAERRPPMPWFNLSSAPERDLKAMYHFVRSLGAKGTAAPDYVPPGQAVTTPYFDFVPKNLPTQMGSAK